jgi:hypothetical protein
LKAISLVILVAGAMSLGCHLYKDNPATCRTNDECASKVCNLVTYYCVPVGDVDSGQPEGGTGGTGGAGVDASGGSQAEAGTIIDAPMDQRVRDAPVDTRVPDAAGTCGVNVDCTDPAKAFCVAGVCVGCQSGLDGGTNACTAPTGVCDSLTGKCVACTASSHCATLAAPICDTTKNTCVGCAADLQCQTKNATLPACRADGQCVQCTSTTAATACVGTSPACDTTTNTCVQCTSAATCSGATPICGTTEKCQACAVDTECVALNDPARAACATTGACVQCTATNNTKCMGTTNVCNTTSNKCVQCLTNATCSGATPICATATSTCRGCATAADCSGLAGHTACASTGACAQCTDNTTCSGTTPICATTTNTCRKCSTDSECSGVGPGVCMLDGHCATEAETVYVGTLGTVTCSETNTGTVQAPVCSVQAGVTLAKKNSAMVVLIRGTLSPASANIAVSSPVTIVGKNSAVVSPTASPGADAITITSGEIYLRNLTIQGAASPATGMGIKAAPDPGSSITLHLDTCAVINNPGGGILLNGAAFDIKNTSVTGNGPGTTGTTTWGGILEANMPASGATNLDFVTIQNNVGGGLTCSAGILGTAVLSTGNTTTVSQISPACAVTGCTPASATCGEQSPPQ